MCSRCSWVWPIASRTMSAVDHSRPNPHCTRSQLSFGEVSDEALESGTVDAQAFGHLRLA